MPKTTAQTLERIGLIPVLRARNAAQARAVVQAMIAGGVTVVEVTMTVPGALDVLKELKQEYGADLLLGSGIVTTAEQAKATIEAGAEFVVSPSLHPEVIAMTKSMKKISIPGALTPTEAITAWNAGADYVKIFPCSAVGGASYLKALLASFPQLKLIPTGGVTQQTAASLLRAGARALGCRQRLGQPCRHRRRNPGSYHRIRPRLFETCGPGPRGNRPGKIGIRTHLSVNETATITPESVTFAIFWRHLKPVQIQAPKALLFLSPGRAARQLA